MKIRISRMIVAVAATRQPAKCKHPTIYWDRQLTLHRPGANGCLPAHRVGVRGVTGSVARGLMKNDKAKWCEVCW